MLKLIEVTISVNKPATVHGNTILPTLAKPLGIVTFI